MNDDVRPQSVPRPAERDDAQRALGPQAGRPAEGARPPSAAARVGLTIAAALLVILGVAPFVVLVLTALLVEAPVGWLGFALSGAWAVASAVAIFAIQRALERGGAG